MTSALYTHACAHTPTLTRVLSEIYTIHTLPKKERERWRWPDGRDEGLMAKGPRTQLRDLQGSLSIEIGCRSSCPQEVTIYIH